MANILQDKAISKDLQKHFFGIAKIVLQYLKFYRPKEEYLDLDYIFYLEKVFK